MSAFHRILEKYRKEALSQRDKGARFERLMQAFLRAAPMYAGELDEVWLWEEFPHRGQFGGKDTGIDLVARTREGEFWAVQCKCYAEGVYIDKAAVDGFLATSGKRFVDDEGRDCGFAQRLWISTTNRWGSEAVNIIRNQSPPVARLNLIDLERAPVDWEALEKGHDGAKARTARKSLRPHQEKALLAFREHFAAGGTRGRCIMASGINQRL